MDKKALSRYQTLTEDTLSVYLSKLPSFADNLDEAIRYATLNQGKRLRPAMLFAIGEALEIDLKQLLAPACALELIHCYSLVHDDLPAMDDDALRRGKPTCHIAFNEATAILVGDAQQTLAFEILSNATEITAESRLQMLQILSHASGVNGMVSGQQIDINSEDQEISLARLQQMHQLKTGALLKAALHLGACQHPDYGKLSAAIEKLGNAVGLAFQVQDDILDIESDTETLGKTQGKDVENNKSTYPRLLGLDEAKQYRDDLISQALEQLEHLPINSPFLKQLVEYISARDH